MSINSLHPDYVANLGAWTRARDVLAGEDTIKAAGERYLPRLGSASDDDYNGYRQRASFFNATARTADGYLGLIFRRAPFLTVPAPAGALGRGVSAFLNDADMRGSTLCAYTREIVGEVIAVGRAGSLVDWEEGEQRPYVTSYRAEQILNWRSERVNGRLIPTLIVLHEQKTEPVPDVSADENDGAPVGERLRVLRLVDATLLDGASEAPQMVGVASQRQSACVVEIWEPHASEEETQWICTETYVPRRLGRPLPLIPFVFHGPRHSRLNIDKLPLADIIAVNLDHYRLSADYRHGIHYTALPTAWVSGFDPKTTSLRIGASTAWVTSNPGARAGFLEFRGEGLSTFERALDRDERLLAMLGSRLLEPSKKVGETAEAIELRQSGESSVLGGIAASISDSLTQVMRWVYWWHSTEPLPDELTSGQVSIQLNTDFSVKGMSPQELQAVVAAWQAGALSRETMIDLFRRGEVLADAGDGERRS
jgi:hypothetical protein